MGDVCGVNEWMNDLLACPSWQIIQPCWFPCVRVARKHFALSARRLFLLDFAGHRMLQSHPSQGEKRLEWQQHFPVAPDWDSCSAIWEPSSQCLPAPPLRIDPPEAENLPGAFFFSSAYKRHFSAFSARGRLLLNSGSREMSPATCSPSREVYLIVHAGPPPGSASGVSCSLLHTPQCASCHLFCEVFPATWLTAPTGAPRPPPQTASPAQKSFRRPLVLAVWQPPHNRWAENAKRRELTTGWVVMMDSYIFGHAPGS